MYHCNATIHQIFSDPPSSPKKLRVTKVTMSSVTIEWVEPEDSGGAPLTGYNIDIKRPGSSTFDRLCLLDGDMSTYTCVKLTDDSEYDFQIWAENEAGVSAAPARLEKPVRTKAKASKC